MKMALCAFWLPKVRGRTRDIAYFLLTLGRKCPVPVFWLPKVRKGVPARVVGFGGEGDL